MGLVLSLLLQSAPDFDRLLRDLDDDAIEVREEAERRLLDAGEPARPVLARAAKDAGDAGRRAARLLRWLDFSAVLPPTALHREPGLRGDLLSAEATVRSRAILATLPRVLAADLHESIQSVLELALDDPDPFLRLRAALLRAYDPDGRVESVALDFLHRWDHPDFEGLDDRSMESLLGDAARRVARTGRLGTEEILVLLRSPNAKIRAEATSMIRSLKRWEALPAVVRQLTEADPCVLEETIRCLREGGRPAAPEVLLDILRRRPLFQAASELSRQGARSAVPELLRLIPLQRDRTMSRALLSAASELDAPATEGAALGILEEFLRSTETDSGLAYEAMGALAHVGQSRHFPLLLQAWTKTTSASRFNRWLGPSRDFPQDLARCAGEGHVGDLLDLCRPQLRGEYVSIHALEDPTNSMGWNALPHVDQAVLLDACFRRIVDPERSEEQRWVAAQALAGCLVPERRPEALRALQDEDLPLTARMSLIEAMPWTQPGPLGPDLLKFADRILRDSASPLRPIFLQQMTCSQDPDVRRVLCRALIEDETIPPASFGFMYSVLPEGDGGIEVVRRRLVSRNPAVVLAAAEAIQFQPPPDLQEHFLKLFDAPSIDVRRAGGRLLSEFPAECHRTALRALAARETDPEILQSVLTAARTLRDRPTLEAVLGRSLSAPSLDAARIQLILEAGSAAEVLPLEARLRELPVELAASALPVLARHDADAARRQVPWAIRHEHASIRAAGATAAGVARLTDSVSELRAMALTENRGVRVSALRALMNFDRAVWIDAFRRALRQGGWATLQPLCEAIATGGAPELAPDLAGYLDSREVDGSLAAHALDASLRPEAYRRWASATPAERVRTVADLPGAAASVGIRLILSEGARACAAMPLKQWDAGGGSLGAMLSKSFAEERPWVHVFLTHESTDEGVTVLTIEEARAQWRNAPK